MSNRSLLVFMGIDQQQLLALEDMHHLVEDPYVRHFHISITDLEAAAVDLFACTNPIDRELLETANDKDFRGKPKLDVTNVAECHRRFNDAVFDVDSDNRAT